MSHDNGSVLVELRPFQHQVGGHTCVLELNRSTICKPHVEREAWFYMHASDQFKEFMPKYRGEIEVTCDINSDKMCLVACLPKSMAADHGLVTFNPPVSFENRPYSALCQKRKRGDGTELDGDSPIDTAQTSRTSNSRPPASEPEAELWSIQCMKRQINRHGFWTNNQPQKFIMLENLVHEYRRPCLLDLKMGRRQYGDDSSAEKRVLLETRCRQSTSGSLGFRICGTQVYKEISASYVTHDKYHGRQLDTVGVEQELLHFLHNGETLHNAVITAIITKLQKLKVFLETQSDFKLYSCSLLVMYDGCYNGNHLPVNCPKRRSPHNGGTLHPTHVTDTLDYPAVNQASDITGSADTKLMCSVCSHPKVDVRLIDFAHASSGYYQNTGRDIHLDIASNDRTGDDVSGDIREHISHSNHHTRQDGVHATVESAVGANEGIIFGLDNLAAILQSFL